MRATRRASWRFMFSDSSWRLFRPMGSQCRWPAGPLISTIRWFDARLNSTLQPSGARIARIAFSWALP
jgi:hypothetical protein